MLGGRVSKKSVAALRGNARLFNSAAGKEKLFDKILIANRGEIAVRVMKTCKRLGIKTVAVYSEADVNTVAVKMADEAVCVGPAPSNQSYLNIKNIVAAVKQTGAQAVHPGYGFLSENKAFADALEKAGVAFLGPGFEAIRAMGDKIESKVIAKEAGVSIIPGFMGEVPNAEEAVKVARDIGYPVMIKASAGGGGKGLRIAYDDDEVRSSYKLSKEEAASSFGDDRMLIEKFIEDPRHIEIQLIADKHGNVVPFPERECSIQRRNQKVIEEAPSVLLDQETRIAMGEQAKMLAKKVGYVSAGTVEFLCDKNKNFYFLEMNTRLQVEHPVTELISKVDLVEQMIRVAAGHKLPDWMLQGPLKIHGHAFESRVYAEDPFRGFLPSIGRLLRYREPIECPGVRCDSGVKEGSDISFHYDPMISKLITYGENREDALEKMKFALDHYVIRGPGHNASFLQEVYRHPRFVSGKITTKFIEEEYPEGFEGVKLNDKEMREIAVVGAIMRARNIQASRQLSGRLSQPVGAAHYPDNLDKLNPEEIEYVVQATGEGYVPRFRVLSGDNSSANAVAIATKNNLQECALKMYVSTDGPFGKAKEVYLAELETDDVVNGKNVEKTYQLAYIDGQWVSIGNINWDLNDPLFKGTIDGEKFATQQLSALPEGYQLQHHGAIHDVIVRSELEQKYAVYMQPKPEIDTSGMLLCPMPGMLISIAVEVGQEVQPGQELAVVEAMKMRNALRSEKKGKIKKILVKPGDSLKVDEVILEFEQ